MNNTSNNLLRNLCKYYLECITLEEQTGVAVFQTGKYGLKYLEGKYGADPYLQKMINWEEFNERN